ncbi:hypothetical protein Vadar_007616 [Vaccinium darrowii]|uniref:Uncharacterized protein n=1 Tax=Vaccinium darrowii TaxID=229202 RepID=A0ACB7X807_9ERIC|nr:hypothetical protein Vadar_007616 [Vaccinium darrowii]
MIADGMEDKDKWLTEGIAGIQHHTFYMHRALVELVRNGVVFERCKGGPLNYDASSAHFTIRMFYRGMLGSAASKPYSRDSVGYLDYCHVDEISLIELYSMIRQVDTFVSIDFYTMTGGQYKKLKSNSEAMGLGNLLNGYREVNVYTVKDKGVDIHVGTQESQVRKTLTAFRPKKSHANISLPKWKTPRPKTMGTPTMELPQSQGSEVNAKQSKRDATRAKSISTEPNKPSKGKEKATRVHDLVDVQIDEEDESDAYELDHETSSDDEEVFYDSDYALTDDDELFQQNIDCDTEFDGV